MLPNLNRMWKDASVAIIGGGPSLTADQVTQVRDRNYRTIGVNDAYQFGVMIDILFWGDRCWYFGNTETGHTGHRDRVQRWPGIRITCSSDCADEPNVISLLREDAPGLHLPPRIKWYANSGLTALGLAVVLGAKKVVLLGFDGQTVGGRHNWHPDNVNPVDSSVFAHHRKSATECADDVAKWPLNKGVVVWNCTPDSAYSAFPCADLKEVL